MAGDVKFGITKDSWPWGQTIDVPIMTNMGTTGIWYQPTGEVVAAKNLFKSLDAGAHVCVVEAKDSWYLVSAAVPHCP